MRCCTVSCIDSCTRLSDSRTRRESCRMRRMYTLLTSTNIGIITTSISASVLSIMYMQAKAPTNISTVESVLGSVSVRNVVTLATSSSKRLSTSPEWKCSRLCHSDCSMRCSAACCMRFCALTPSMLRTHTPAIFTAKLSSISAPMSPTAQYIEPRSEPEATSMACFIAHTCARLSTTSATPSNAFSVACNRLPRHACQSHRSICFTVYLSEVFIFIKTQNSKFKTQDCVSVATAYPLPTSSFLLTM